MLLTSGDQWLAPTDDGPKVLKEAIGLPLRIISGYKGTADIRVAVESGEVDGLCGFSWASVRATWRKAIESGQVVVVLQSAPKASPDLQKYRLPSASLKLRARQLIEAGIHTPSSITYTYSLPPGTPKDRVQILRTAFSEMVKDKDFLGDAAKANLEIAPFTGEEVERNIETLFRTPPAVVAKLKDVIK